MRLGFVIFLFLPILFFPEICHGQLRPPDSIQREERSTIAPFDQFRERSTQRITYTHVNPYLSSEFEFKHIVFSYAPGREKNYEDRLYQASFRGHNMTSPLEFKAGRIWTGNDLFFPVDGVSWFYPWGNRLSTTLNLGRIANPTFDNKLEKPAYSEGRLHYKFNDRTFLALQSSQEFKEHYFSSMIGFAIESLKAIGEFKSGGATDTFRLGVQYYNDRWCDVTADYRINLNDKMNSGVMRNLLAAGAGNFYWEAGMGSKFYFGQAPPPKSDFLEGTMYWGNSRFGQDNLSIGWLLERDPASVARTISGTAERVVSKNTRLNLTLAETRFDDGEKSMQNLESRLHRKVDWGYFELRFALITAGRESALQKETTLRAGYEF